MIKRERNGNRMKHATRYWPRGGGFSTFDICTKLWVDEDAIQKEKLSATASFLLQDETIATADFEAETESEVKKLVEKWVQEQYDNELHN